MDRVRRRAHAHPLRASPRDRTQIGVDEAIAKQDFRLGRVDRLDGPRDLEVQDARDSFQALRVLGRLENLAAIGALALEHRARVVERVGQHMNLRVPPVHHFAVEPDPAVAIVEIRSRHGRTPLSLVPGFAFDLAGFYHACIVL